MKAEMKSNLFQYDAKTKLSEVVPLGMQHVVAAAVGIVTPGIMIAGASGMGAADRTLIIQTCLVFSGFATLIQLFKPFGIGSRLPVMMGTSFAYVPILLSITNGEASGFGMIIGAQMVGSIVSVLVGLGINKIRILFPPLVTGTVILSIGFSLFDVAVGYMAGGKASPTFGSLQNWGVGLATFAIVFFFTYFVKGVFSLASILIGVIAGYLLSIALGMVDFSAISNAGYFQMVQPLHFKPEFEVIPIVTLTIMFIVNAVQAIGDLTALTVSGLDREPTNQELGGGIIGNSITTFVGAFFGALPTATFSQNIGLVSVTKVVNRGVFLFASVVLMIAGFVPKISALLTTIPQAVIGGATIAVFASISMTGMKMIASAGFSRINTGIIGLSLAFGIGIPLTTGSLAGPGFPAWVDQIFGGSEVVLTTIIAIILNLLLNHTKVGREKA
ncbi:uracil-xanthine permease family protein [Enterococcus alishanensis]|uniref:Purine/pyrimidine permease n=1 Tax=Enterococcus alishanensis TaxID=1303817 RepID=A0ABS6TCD4_9ENTE|nr:solute carrier family 23 protein [Enterococcus alishanensis]MBV7390547.1 purine/pyrimidine permease [Enterococcus alishanensis]